MNERHYLDQPGRELLEGLKAMAADGPCAAPGHVEERLRTEFRRYSRRRNLLTWVPAFSAAAAAGIALLLWIHSEKPRPAPAPATVAALAVAPWAEEDADASFYPLPEAEALPAVENAMVVRVQLPVASLQLMGVPVNADGEVSVQADLLLGQDGLARGVRLVE